MVNVLNKFLQNTNKTSLHLVTLFSLIIFTIFFYLPTTKFGYFVLDDSMYTNSWPINIVQVTWNEIKWVLTNIYFANYSPFLILTHILDYQIFADDPTPRHWQQIIIHAMNTCLVFLIFKRFFQSFWLVIFGTLIFSLHPLQVEPISWLASKKDLLSGFFGLLTILLYLQYRENRTIFKYLLICFTFLIGILTKPSLIPIPIILIAIELLASKSNSYIKNKWQLTETLPLLICSVIIGLISFYAQVDDERFVSSASNINLSQNLTIGSYYFGRYLLHFFYPNSVGFFYQNFDWGNSDLVINLGFTAVFIFGLIFCYLKKENLLALGLLWFGIGITLFIQFKQIGIEVNANRWMYLPQVGLILIILTIASKLDYLPKKIIVFLGVLILLLLGLKTSEELYSWRHSVSRITQSITENPKSPALYSFLSLAYDRAYQKSHNQSLLPLIEANLQRALKIDPYYNGALDQIKDLKTRNLLRANLAQLIPAMTFTDEAEHQIKLQKQADLINSLLEVVSPAERDEILQKGELLYLQNQSFFQSHFKMRYREAIFLIHKKSFPRAIQILNDILPATNNPVEIYNALALIYLNTGESKLAIENSELAIASSPGTLKARYNLALTYLLINQKQEALKIANEILEKHPFDLTALEIRTRILSTS